MLATTIPNICERCHRLNKPCGLQTPAPPRKRRLDGSLESARPTGATNNGALHGGAPGPTHNGHNSGNAHAANGRHLNGHQQPGSKPQQRAAPKPTRVAELERRLEDLTSRLDSVSRQQKLHREINPPESDDPNHRTTPLDIFRLKAHWGYMYPARHIFPSDNVNLSPTSGRAGAEPTSGFLPRQTFSQQQAGISPPVTVIASPTSNANNGSVSEGSSTSNAPVSNCTTREKDDHQPAATYIPSFCFPSQRPYFRQVSAAAEAADRRHKEVAANIAKIAAGTAKQQQRYYPPTETSGGEGAGTPASLPPLQSVNLTPENIWPKNDEAEVMLSEFRKFMMPLFPFVIIPEYITSEKLRCGRPTLWKSVMMAACHLDGARQILMGNQLLGELAAAAFLQPRRTLDMLQAVLVLIGWFHYNINSFQLINFFYLARAMCVSLGISEPLPPLVAPPRHKKAGGVAGGNDPTPGGGFNNAGRNGAEGPNDGEDTDCNPLRQTTDYPPVALEQMRTFAGTFYLVALSTTTNKRPDIMMNTPYLETCCQVLERQMEYPSDAYLLQLVRIQQLSQSISLAYSLRTDGMQMGMSLRHMMQNLRQQIEAFKTQIPEAYHNDVNLIGHLHTAEILLYEAGLQEASSHPLPKGEPMSISDRLELLWACTYAIKDLMRNRFQEHITDQPRFLCLSSFDFMYAFLTALKLMTLQAPGWDGRRVRSELAFDDLIDRQILDLQLLAERRSQNRFRISPEDLQIPMKDRSSANTRPASDNGSGTNSNGSNSGSGSPLNGNEARTGNATAPNANNTGGKDNSGGAANVNRATMDPRQDPFTRLAERLIELKSMISKELDRLPGPSDGALHPLILGAGPANTMGPLPFASMMDAAMPNAPPDRVDSSTTLTGPGQASHQKQSDMDTEMMSSSAMDGSSGATGMTGMDGNINVATTTPHQQQAQQLHLAPPGAVQAASLDAPFGGIPINAEPILSFADATIDYMQNLDGPGFPDLFNAPGWESYMDANMGTPSFYDSWGQTNL
ncbi:hypothetical protein SBRCBS47491_009764 [Sporothrix bragantina]|uniref:C6 zinc finger domain containing protein n=1 Tax=Sporothrix bragantina TaxID=671064 RepID=A0ABP0D0M0_9PEZI